MRKTAYAEIENPILIDTKHLQALLQCGYVTAMRIAEQAGARVEVGKSVRFNRKKIESYLDKITM